MRAKYELTDVSLKSDLRSTAVIAVPCVISSQSGPRYNGTRLYLFLLLFQHLIIQFINNWFISLIDLYNYFRTFFSHFRICVLCAMIASSNGKLFRVTGPVCGEFTGPVEFPSTHWGRDKMAVISQTTLSNAFSWMKKLEFRLRVQWSLFLRVQLTIS